MHSWNDEEQMCVLRAIEEGVSVKHVTEIIMEGTGRSRKSVIKKLKNIGYLRCCGRTFSSKQGFVR